MNRKDFFKKTLNVFMLLSVGKYFIKDTATAGNGGISNTDFAGFGVVHLNNTSLDKAITFWVTIVGLKLRVKNDLSAEFGTENKTLVVVHQSALKPFQPGYSGLYHFAIHPPNISEFANMLYRLIVNKYPCSPTDHTMSKSVYLNDPDGITIEFALETPERFKRVVTTGGLQMEAADGTLREASAALDVDEVLQYVTDKSTVRTIHEDSKIGHIHLYAQDVNKLNAFYKQIGFQQFNYLPQFMYADVGAGGVYKHRIAMNEWHGHNKPTAPKGSAGLRQYEIVYYKKTDLEAALARINNYTEKKGAYEVQDPSGNLVVLTTL